MTQSESVENTVTPDTNAPIQEQQPKGFYLSDSARGTIYCLLSDIIFSFSYFFVRWLTTYSEIHRDWTFCFKELITTAGALPIFLYFWMKGKCAPPPIKIITLIVIAAFFCEFVGVRSHIVAFASIGMMLGNPLIRTFTILGTAIIGLFFLREKLTPLKLITMGILICAIFILGFSQSKGKAAPKAEVAAAATVENTTATKPAETTAPAAAPAVKGSNAVVIPAILVPSIEWIRESLKGMGIELSDLFIFGLSMALLTGFGYALYTILLRFILRKAKSDGEATGKPSQPVPIFFIVATVCGFGALVGGLFLYKDRGLEGFYTVPSANGNASIPVECWIFVGLAGGLNVVCFYLKNLALRYATASKVAIFSVLQIFLATVLGICFFSEPTNALVYAGLALTILGIVLASKTN